MLVVSHRVYKKPAQLLQPVSLSIFIRLRVLPPNLSAILIHESRQSSTDKKKIDGIKYKLLSEKEWESKWGSYTVHTMHQQIHFRISSLSLSINQWSEIRAVHCILHIGAWSRIFSCTRALPIAAAAAAMGILIHAKVGYKWGVNMHPMHRRAMEQIAQ